MKKATRPITRLLGMALILVSAPALADVKAGVDAWGRGDYATAIKEWRGPADAGDADAQFNLGQAYKLGNGVPKDLGQAEKWYKSAADQGHLQANDNYGLLLFQKPCHISRHQPIGAKNAPNMFWVPATSTGTSSPRTGSRLML